MNQDDIIVEICRPCSGLVAIECADKDRFALFDAFRRALSFGEIEIGAAAGGKLVVRLAESTAIGRVKDMPKGGIAIDLELTRENLMVLIVVSEYYEGEINLPMDISLEAYCGMRFEPKSIEDIVFATIVPE